MVYFVGAGPGAKDLITVRAMKLLQLADVIIYAGSLVNEELLEYAKENCEIYNSAYMNLEEVLEVVKNAAAKDKTVVRLHTGDASIYGAIREQMEELDRENIEYEVVPGVSSFLAAAAALKCEYTVPEISQSVILTRMEGRTPVPESEKISSLAEHGTSMVVFLSMGHLKKLREELLKGRYTEDTPCAIVYKASWKEQKCVKGTLKELEEMAEKNNITKTALVLVGNFLGTEYNYSKLYDAEFKTEYRK
jgi:precorrin-4/cobalt-precorrin-4 C11-methyltransferase